MSMPSTVQEPRRRHQRHGINHQSLTLSLPGEVAAQLRRHARKDGMSMSLIVVQALEKHLGAPTAENASDQAQAAHS